MRDLSGTNGLIIGKRAMKYRGCQGCGKTRTPLGAVVTIAKILETSAFKCRVCGLEVVATIFQDTNGFKGFCAFWKPLPDLDEQEEKEINETLALCK